MRAALLEEIQEVLVFAELLRQEQALLTATRAADALLPLVERKSACAARLKVLSDRRDQMLSGNGNLTGRPAIEAWLAANPRGNDIDSHWQRLLELAAEARSLNETNGKLIGLHWQHNQAALTTLMAAADRAMTYGPDGQQKGAGGGRSFGSA